jgi:hypothetical protein
MSDDSFVREVNEELRQDQLKALWRAMACCSSSPPSAVLAATAGYVGWNYWTSSAPIVRRSVFAALQLAPGPHRRGA